MLIKDKKALVVGVGTSGKPTITTLLELGARVIVNDQKTPEDLKELIKSLENKNVEWILGEHPKNVDGFDLVVLSPGVPTDLPFIKEAKEKGIEVIGELELAYRLCRGKFIAITGTNGKTTTTSLTGEIFKNANKETYVVGNIGIAAVSKARDASEDAVMVTETSSFQLESIVNFKPIIAAVLNITPDHLNRHKTMENYIDAKAKVFINQDQNNILILNGDDPLTYGLMERAKGKVILFSRKKKLDEGAFVDEGYILVKKKNKEGQRICRVDELRIPGNHNLENALAAAAIAYWWGIEEEVIAKTLKSFSGVEHRIEFVDQVNGISFINDSKGTNPDASIRAVEAMKAPIVLIAGGMDKGGEFDEFIQSFNGKVKYMILIGETALKIKATGQKYGFDQTIIVKNMEEAVTKAYEVAQKGDMVLLSPACASWDMYPNFEVRGKHFKESVEKLGRTH